MGAESNFAVSSTNCLEATGTEKLKEGKLKLVESCIFFPQFSSKSIDFKHSFKDS